MTDRGYLDAWKIENMRMSSQILRCLEKAAEGTVEKVKDGRLKRFGNQLCRLC